MSGSRYVLEAESVGFSYGLALRPHSCSSRELFLISLLPSAPEPFADAEEEQFGEAGSKTYQSEGPVGHTSDNISVAGMSVELRGLQGWRRTLLHWCGCGIHATGLDATADGQRRGEGPETQPLGSTACSVGEPARAPWKAAQCGREAGGAWHPGRQEEGRLEGKAAERGL